MLYEEDDDHFNAEGYSVKGYRGVAWRALGWEVESQDEDGEPEGRTGKVVCRMVGDDRHFAFDEDELTPIKREEFCGVCGQIGCHHDGR